MHMPLVLCRPPRPDKVLRVIGTSRMGTDAIRFQEFAAPPPAAVIDAMQRDENAKLERQLKAL